MEIRITTKQMLKALYILSWIIFIGLSIEAGSYISNAIFTLYVNERNASYLHLSELFVYDKGYFLIVLLFMFIVAVLKATIFYRVIVLLQENKIDLSRPFNKDVGKFLFLISYLSFGIGLFSFWGINYAEWLTKLGIKMPDKQQLHLAGADVWLFMSITLFIIAQIFKRGIEIQSENELTI